MFNRTLKQALHRFVMRVQGLHYDPRWQLVTDAKPILKRVRVVNPPYVVTCLSSKPVYPSHGFVMSHDTGTAAPSRATMQKQGVEPSPYQIRNKDYHIVKERSALSLWYYSALYMVSS